MSFWDRQLTRRQTMVAVFTAGFLSAFAIMAIGDYMERRRLPTWEDLPPYRVASRVVGPVLSAVAM